MTASRGFTLLEVMIALALFGFVVTAVSASITSASNATIIIQSAGDLDDAANRTVAAICNELRGAKVTSPAPTMTDAPLSVLSYRPCTKLTPAGAVHAPTPTTIAVVNRCLVSSSDGVLALGIPPAWTGPPLATFGYGVPTGAAAGFFAYRTSANPDVVVVGVTLEGVTAGGQALRRSAVRQIFLGP
jgi:prepilin-type N-terminal cleavage/methylation domain-containing protein